jgi:hypothetical protein
LVLVVIAAAHAGLFVLLTVGARGDIDEIENRRGVEALEQASKPGPRPAGAEDLPDWLHRHDLWEDRREWQERGRLVSMLGYGLLVSFLAQAGVTAVLLRRSLHKRYR